MIKHDVLNIINEEEKRQENEIDSANQRKTLISSLVQPSQCEKKNSVNSNEILVGFETTSTALSWFSFYMSKYPHVQEKIKNELKEHSLRPHMSLTEHVLEKLIYVECVTKEVLRFAPIAAGIVREAIDDDVMDGIAIQKGDLFWIAIQNLHHNDKYWKIDPKKFDPERFLHEDRSPARYACMPFGGGHRTCIGQDLAFLELKIAIIHLMQRLTFEYPGLEANNSGGFIQRITCFPKHMAVRVIFDSNNKRSS